MRVLGCLILSVLAQVIICGFNTPVAAITRNSPQEEFLSKVAYGNFACKVNSVIVTTENPGELELITVENIREAFINVATLEWAHVAQASFSSFDGRNGEKILGTPGGDMGEFILSLHAYAKVAGSVPSRDDVQTMFERYLKAMTREKFFYETDEKAYTKLAVATGCRNLHISTIGGMKRKREEIIVQSIIPEHIGDPFIRFLVTNSSSLEINVDIVQSALAAYHNILWTSPSPLAQKLCYLELKGPQSVGALVNIKTSSFCVDQGLIPMVSPQLSCPAPVFINHPEAAKILRREFATVITLGTTVGAQDVLSTHNTLAENTLDIFIATCSPAIPTYSVTHQNNSPLHSPDGVRLSEH